jgi:hypothetical protein
VSSFFMVNFKELLFRIKSVFIIRPLCVSHKPQSSKKLKCFEFCLREKMFFYSFQTYFHMNKLAFSRILYLFTKWTKYDCMFTSVINSQLPIVKVIPKGFKHNAFFFIDNSDIFSRKQNSKHFKINVISL